MSLSYNKQNNDERTRVIEALCFEAENLMKEIKEAGLEWTALYSYLSRHTSKLEWMIIERIYKGGPLENLDSTLLIIQENYIEMLKHIIVLFQNVLQNTTTIKRNRIVTL